MNIFQFPQYICEKCGHDQFEVYSNEYCLALVCTSCQNTMIESEELEK